MPSGREFDKRKREEEDGEEGLCCDAVKRIGVNREHRLGGSQGRKIIFTSTTVETSTRKQFHARSFLEVTLKCFNP